MVTKFLTRIAAAAAAILVLSATVAAHEIETLEPVIVKGDAALGTTDSASQAIVRGSDLQARPPYRPGEILETIPGLIVSQHSGEGKANQYFLRGFNLDHGTDLSITLDGMPVNLRTHAHGQGYADLNFLIPELVSRLEYKKGPYYADEGDFSSAGAAHLHLPDRLERNTALVSVGRFGYRRALLAGSNQAPAESGPTDGKQAHSNNWLYALETMQQDGPWARPDDVVKFNGVLRFAHGTAQNGFSVTAMAYDNRWNSTDQIPKRAVDSGLINRFGTLDPSDGGRSSRYSLSGKWQRRDEGSSTQANAYVIYSKLNLFSNFTYFANDPVNGDQFEQSDKRLITGANVARTWFATWAGREVENTLGLQLRSDRINVGLFNTVARTRISTTRDDRVTETALGSAKRSLTRRINLILTRFC